VFFSLKFFKDFVAACVNIKGISIKKNVPDFFIKSSTKPKGEVFRENKSFILRK